MRFTVEPSPAGGYHVRLVGSDAPLSHHDTEEEAETRRRAYERGAGEPRGELVDLRDGSEVLVRPVRPEDKPLFVAGWERFGEESRYRRFMGFKSAPDRPRAGVLHGARPRPPRRARCDRPADRRGLGVARYMRNADRPDSAEAAVAVIDAWQGRGLGGMLLRRLCRRAGANGITTFTASLLTGNRSMLALFERLGAVTDARIRRGRDGDRRRAAGR